ncbi:uncharacterized protein LODBEIA_P38310 [Lodderomyces beijingensis]|uniref:C3H1-type domain-containing protein n=1 Tax=Lodderomyces beijingensis TaxID=1775926 RepID=A0ABP0ZQJ7_9ASCO
MFASSDLSHKILQTASTTDSFARKNSNDSKFTTSSLSSLSPANSIVDFKGDLLPDLWQTSSNESYLSDSFENFTLKPTFQPKQQQQQQQPQHASHIKFVPSQSQSPCQLPANNMLHAQFSSPTGGAAASSPFDSASVVHSRNEMLPSVHAFEQQQHHHHHHHQNHQNHNQHLRQHLEQSFEVNSPQLWRQSSLHQPTFTHHSSWNNVNSVVHGNCLNSPLLHQQSLLEPTSLNIISNSSHYNHNHHHHQQQRQFAEVVDPYQVSEDIVNSQQIYLLDEDVQQLNRQRDGLCHSNSLQNKVLHPHQSHGIHPHLAQQQQPQLQQQQAPAPPPAPAPPHHNHLHLQPQQHFQQQKTSSVAANATTQDFVDVNSTITLKDIARLDPPILTSNSNKPAVNTQLYKTELCGPFMKTGTCTYGSKCQFAHGEEELKHVERPPKWRSKPCSNWTKYGSCRYGNRCCFKHGD